LVKGLTIGTGLIGTLDWFVGFQSW